MPLVRYFLVVGSVLIALLFSLTAWLPKSQDLHKITGQLPTIHIQSDRKWPERVVFDTRVPAIPAPQAGGAVSAAATTSAPSDELAKAREDNAFAKMQASEPYKPEPSASTKPEPTLRRKHKSGKGAAAQLHARRTARPSQFDWFGNITW